MKTRTMVGSSTTSHAGNASAQYLYPHSKYKNQFSTIELNERKEMGTGRIPVGVIGDSNLMKQRVWEVGPDEVGS